LIADGLPIITSIVPGVHLRPAARGDRLTDHLLLGIGEHVGDVEPAGDLDVHARRHVGLRVEVDDESPHPRANAAEARPRVTVVLPTPP
jgi:hypothetical protein